MMQLSFPFLPSIRRDRPWHDHALCLQTFVPALLQTAIDSARMLPECINSDFMQLAKFLASVERSCHASVLFVLVPVVTAIAEDIYNPLNFHNGILLYSINVGESL
jgi:hypothetical protein